MHCLCARVHAAVVAWPLNIDHTVGSGTQLTLSCCKVAVAEGLQAPRELSRLQALLKTRTACAKACILSIPYAMHKA